MPPHWCSPQLPTRRKCRHRLHRSGSFLHNRKKVLQTHMNLHPSRWPQGCSCRRFHLCSRRLPIHHKSRLHRNRSGNCQDNRTSPLHTCMTHRPESPFHQSCRPKDRCSQSLQYRRRCHCHSHRRGILLHRSQSHRADCHRSRNRLQECRCNRTRRFRRDHCKCRKHRVHQCIRQRRRKCHPCPSPQCNRLRKPQPHPPRCPRNRIRQLR